MLYFRLIFIGIRANFTGLVKKMKPSQVRTPLVIYLSAPLSCSIPTEVHSPDIQESFSTARNRSLKRQRGSNRLALKVLGSCCDARST